MKTYEEMADSVFRRVDEYQTRQKKRRRNIIIRTVAGVAFLFLVLAVSLNLFKPILARELPLVGGAFTYIQDKLTYAGLYDNYAYQVGETASNKGIDITLSEVYCDGTYLYVSFVVDGIDFKRELVDGNLSNFQLDYSGNTYITANNKIKNLSGEGFWGGLEGEFIDEDTFVGVEMLHLENETPFPENFKLNIDITAIGPLNTKSKMVLGNWGFSVDAVSSEDDVVIYEIGEAKNGYSIDKVVVSPIIMTVYVSYPQIDNYDVINAIDCFSNLQPSERILSSGLYYTDHAIARVPAKFVSDYLEIYLYKTDRYSEESDGGGREDIEQHAIVFYRLVLNNGKEN
ncbi:MAG: DUF4179 domain-containing protein [Lachnospiraceae bacterium]|nr:DUF4179 domain-containing protein [Lachnospiraceae bacterium]